MTLPAAIIDDCFRLQAAVAPELNNEPLYVIDDSERSGSYQFRTLFPLWAERKMPGDRATMVTPLY